MSIKPSVCVKKKKQCKDLKKKQKEIKTGLGTDDIPPNVTEYFEQLKNVCKYKT